MPEANHFPQITQLQGGVLVPLNVKQKTKTDEQGDLKTYYEFDQIKLNQRVLPSLSQVQKNILNKLQENLHKYIYSIYDQGSQSTIQAYIQRAERQGLSSIVTECEKIMDWIDNCLTYYYNKKDEIFSANDEISLIGITWEFTTDVPVPSDLLTLKEIKELF